MRIQVFILCLGTLACAGCQASAPAAPEPSSPTSMARSRAEARAAALAWTTPPVPRGGAPLARADLPTGELPSHVAAARDGAAQDHVGDEAERRTQIGALEGGPLEFVTAFQTTWQLGSDLDNGGDAPDLWTNRFRVSLEKPTPYFGRASVYGEYVNRHYTFSGANGFVAGTERPFDTVHALSTGVTLFQPVHERWAVFLSGGLTWAAEDGADLSDGFGWSTTLGVGHRLSDVFDLGVGAVLARSVGEDDLFFLAGPQFDWRPNDQWQVVLEGATLEISYKPNRAWELSGAGGFTGFRFRLRKDGPGAGGSFSESGFPLWLQARYIGLEDLDVALRAGIDFDRSFSLIDRSGSTVRTIDSDPAPFVSLRVIWRM